MRLPCIIIKFFHTTQFGYYFKLECEGVIYFVSLPQSPAVLDLSDIYFFHLQNRKWKEILDRMQPWVYPEFNFIWMVSVYNNPQLPSKRLKALLQYQKWITIRPSRPVYNEIQKNGTNSNNYTNIPVQIRVNSFLATWSFLQLNQSKGLILGPGLWKCDH